MRVAGERDQRDAQLEATLLHVKGRTHLRRQRLPLIAIFGTLATKRGQGEHAIYTTDATSIEQLLKAGGLPVLLPPPLPLQPQAGTMHTPADAESFRQTFDRLIWPCFCQLLAQQINGLYVGESLDAQVERAAPSIGRASNCQTAMQASMKLQRSVALLAWLVGIPVLGGGQEVQRCMQAKDTRAGTTRSWATLDLEREPKQKQQASSAMLSDFIAACATAEPPPPEALQPLQREICDWLYQTDRHSSRGRPASGGGQASRQDESGNLRQGSRPSSKSSGTYGAGESPLCR